MDWIQLSTLVLTLIGTMVPIIGFLVASLQSQWKTQNMVQGMSRNMKRLKSTVIQHDRDIAHMKGLLGLPNSQKNVKKRKIELPDEIQQ